MIDMERDLMLSPGNCVVDELTIDGQDYPLASWVICKANADDRNLLYIVPLIDCDPYGRAFDISPQEIEFFSFENLFFIEDERGQDHKLALLNDAVWAHCDDLFEAVPDIYRKWVSYEISVELSKIVGGRK